MKNLSRMATCVYNFTISKGLSMYFPNSEVFQKQSFRFYSLNSCQKHLLAGEPYQYTLYKSLCTSDPMEGLPELTNFPIYVWPSLFNSFRNYVFSKLIIKRYFDENFDVDKFVEGSKQAVEVVSWHLSTGKLNELETYVTPDVIKEIRNNIKNFSLRQQMELAVDKKDIFACYTHNIGIIMPDSPNAIFKELGEERHVEITMAYHVLKGYKNLDAEFKGSFKPFHVPEFEKNLYILSYRFIRDYSEGKTSDWIINGLNHFKPLTRYQ